LSVKIGSGQEKKRGPQNTVNHVLNRLALKLGDKLARRHEVVVFLSTPTETELANLSLTK